MFTTHEMSPGIWCVYEGDECIGQLFDRRRAEQWAAWLNEEAGK